jgi:hypothetical protein
VESLPSDRAKCMTTMRAASNTAQTTVDNGRLGAVVWNWCRRDPFPRKQPEEPGAP